MNALNRAESAQKNPKLSDRHDRVVTYLRLSITDRCNLRCRYCMPEEGVQFLQHNQILSYEELLRLSHIFMGLGVNKIRVTGGEPFVRQGCFDFLAALMGQNPALDLRITTNGVAVAPHLVGLKKLGVGGINLSLDTLDPAKFFQITRRDKHSEVLHVFHECLRLGIPLKVNSVVSEDTSDAEIVEMAALAESNEFDLRFIEIMPFTGGQQAAEHMKRSLEERLVTLFPGISEIGTERIETARRFQVPGYRGRLGIIEGESRKFCSHCNKVRLTSAGMMKNCLYDNGVLDLRELLRSGASDGELISQIMTSVRGKFSDGHETAAKVKKSGQDSMASIGG